MILPRDGRIVVIDDKTEEEALPLLNSLYINGFSALYFNGDKKGLPHTPFNDIRVVFLDLEIIVEGYTGQDNRSKAATTAKILSSVIDTTIPTIYLLVLWSTHEKELLEDFWRYVEENNYKCIFLSVSLDKIKCRAADYDIALIQKEIEGKLKGNDGFRFLIGWENIIHESSNDVINEIQSLYGGEGDPDKFLLGVFKKLAEASAGENLNEDNFEQITQYAMLAFNGTFMDSLENNIFNLSNTGISFKKTTGITDHIVTAKINSKLLLSCGISSVKPGNIYEGNFDLIDNLTNDLFNKPDSVDKTLMKVVFCEVSPICDYVQNTWRTHRIIYGLIIPLEYAKKIKKTAEFVYLSPIFEIESSAKQLVFNLRNYESLPIGELEGKRSICIIRHNLLVVIQHKIASHCSRPGMLSL